MRGGLRNDTKGGIQIDTFVALTLTLNPNPSFFKKENNNDDQ